MLIYCLTNPLHRQTEITLPHHGVDICRWKTITLIKDNELQRGVQQKGCDSRESNPGHLLGRQLCSPLYHQRLISCRFWYVLNDIKISTEYHNSKLIQSAAHTIIFTIFSQGTLQATLVLRKINSVVYFISVYQQHKFLYLLTLLRAKYFEQKLRCELQKGALYFMLR